MTERMYVVVHHRRVPVGDEVHEICQSIPYSIPAHAFEYADERRHIAAGGGRHEDEYRVYELAEVMLLDDDGEPRIERWTLGTETADQPAFSSMCRRGECDRCDLGSIHRPCEHHCHVTRDGAL